MDKKILIIGANGYIGKYLSVFLKTVGVGEVIAVDRTSDSDFWFYSHNIYFYKSDIMDPDFVQQIMIPNKIDTIFYLAGESDIYNNFNNPVNSAASNILPLVKILDNIKNKDINLFFISSTSVHGGKADYVPGTLNPMTPYAASMVACESFINAYSVIGNIDYTIIRVPAIFGGALGKDQLTKWLREIISGDTNDITVDFHPYSKKDFFYIKDLCRVIYYIYNQKEKNRTLDITYGSDKIKNWKELAELVKKISFSDASIHTEARVYDKTTPIFVSSSMDLSLIDLMGLEMGLKETYVLLKNPKSEMFNI